MEDYIDPPGTNSNTFQTTQSDNPREQVADNNQKTNGRLSKFKNKSLLIPLAGIAIVAIVGYGGLYLFNEYQKPDVLGESNLSVDQTQEVIKKIGELIELPSGEVPILATVTDVNSLRDEPFYDRAQNGDRVLIYRNSSMAILYRPAEHKIIKVGTVTITGEEKAPSESESSTESAEIIAPDSSTNPNLDN